MKDKYEQNLKEALFDKAKKEFEEYRQNLMALPVEQVIDKSYETVYKEAFANMIEFEYFSVNLMEFLFLKDNTIDYMYQSWMKIDDGFYNETKEMVEQKIISNCKKENEYERY